MAKVTLDVPDSLLGDVYIAVGKVLRSGQEADRGDTFADHDSGRSEGGGDEPQPESGGPDQVQRVGG
jgi:hypothetical protein